LHGNVLELGLREARDHLIGLSLIVKEITDALLVGAQEGVDLRDARNMNAGGIDQREGGKPLRAADCKLRCNPAAERHADEMNAVKIELVEEVEIEKGKIMDVVEPVRSVGGTEARMLGNKHVELVGERAHERQPGPGAARAVEDQERLPGSPAHQGDVAIL